MVQETEGQPTTDAIDAVKEVRKRAFRNTNPIKAEAFACGDYEEFKKTILDERKFEFAGENMRWRDLVRNNMYSVELYWTFFRNLAIAEDAGGSSTYTDLVSEHDFGYSGGYDKLPYKIATLRTYKNLDPITKEAVYSERQFPNNDIMPIPMRSGQARRLPRPRTNIPNSAAQAYLPPVGLMRMCLPGGMMMPRSPRMKSVTRFSVSYSTAPPVQLISFVTEILTTVLTRQRILQSTSCLSCATSFLIPLRK